MHVCLGDHELLRGEMPLVTVRQVIDDESVPSSHRVAGAGRAGPVARSRIVVPYRAATVRERSAVDPVVRSGLGQPDS
jgi:hypothetical protein